MFDHELRLEMFRAPALPTCIQETDLIKSISFLFGNLSFPIATALTCLRPRFWKDWRKSNGSESNGADRQERIWMLLKQLGLKTSVRGLLQEPWLAVGMVDTETFPDVAQWIDIIAIMAETTEAKHCEIANESRKHARDDDDEQKPPIKRIAMVLRPRNKVSYKPCTGVDCGNCVSCAKAKELERMA
jgi:hypothetical protein